MISAAASKATVFRLSKVMSPRCIACRRSRSLGDPARWRNVSMMVNFSILKIVNGPLTKQTIMKIGDATRHL